MNDTWLARGFARTVVLNRERDTALHRLRHGLPDLLPDRPEWRAQSELFPNDLGAQTDGGRHELGQPLVAGRQVARQWRASEEREHLCRHAYGKEILPVDGEKGEHVVSARVEIPILIAGKLDGSVQLVSHVVQIPLDGLRGHREALGERGSVGEAVLLDLVMNRLKAPPQRPIFEGPLPPHGQSG